MKTIQYSDPVIFSNDGASIARDLTCGIDTRGTSYQCWVRYNWVLIDPNTAGKAKTYAVPIELRATVPFTLAEIAESTLTEVINIILNLILGLPTSYGGTSVLNLAENEAIAALKAAFANVMVVDLEDVPYPDSNIQDPDFVPSVVG